MMMIIIGLYPLSRVPAPIQNLCQRLQSYAILFTVMFMGGSKKLKC